MITENDGYIDNIFTLRDQYHADVVVLLVDYDNHGLAGVAAAIKANSDYAYCVVVDDYAVGNYTFAHEIGHLVGARHDNDPYGSPEAFAHGYRYDPGNWRTIMAVYDAVVMRINYWSSPLNTYNSVAMGTTGWNDNRREWLEQITRVEGFRASYVYPTVSISGPSEIFHPEKGRPNITYTWSANISGGSLPFSYQWSYNGSNVGTGSTYSRTLRYNGAGGGYTQWTLGLTVTDVLNHQAISTKLITEYNSGEFYKYGPSQQQMPKEFLLAQNVPNPFNPSTTISYILPEDGFVSLKIYNTLGNEIATLVNDYKAAGLYSVNWDARNLSNGLYFYRMQTGNISITKKMVLTK
ncbi:MAG: T9SS type A sorting domain-containing protein [Bacteroidetes bacterium]|nr:T9SS type A sorting domain-containing protein [Bacteroidota bacterium]